MKHARLYIFESYCRIHERIDLSMLARKLNMEQVYSLAIIRLKRPGEHRESSRPSTRIPAYILVDLLHALRQLHKLSQLVIRRLLQKSGL